MGVRGLQTFLKENRQSLCHTVRLDRHDSDARPVVPVVVDAWGVIYQLYLDALPWTSGGEYLRLYRLTRRLIRAWRSVGLEPTFVFDGAAPPEKHTTLLKRMQEQADTARLFYTLSEATRSGPFASQGKVILPPFTWHAFARALSSLNVATRFVARGEADGMCVVMAEALGGFVLGKDTDFLILSSGAGEGLKGYAPLDMIEWIEGAPSQDARDAANFTTVGGRRREPHTSRLLPPRGYKSPTLILATYSAPRLCRRLRLPANMLPLFSSLAGNDYTPAAAADMLFQGSSKPSERIERVARILREQLAARVGAGGDHGDAAVELVQRVVRKLCWRPYVDTHEVKMLVDAIVEATIQYVLPRSNQCCAVYPFCGELEEPGCTAALSRVSTPNATPAVPSDTVVAYANAQQRGLLNSITHAWLYPDRVYLWAVLEDPTMPAARASPRATAARYAGYAIAEEALGGLRWPTPSRDELDAIRQDLEACKLLGVDGDEDESDAASCVSDSTVALSAAPTRSVTEYLRQGSSTRIVGRQGEIPAVYPDTTDGDARSDAVSSECSTEPKPIDPSHIPTPACLLPLADRLHLYLAHLGSATPAIEALPARLHPLAAAVRLCILATAEADTTGARRWRRSEVEAVLRAGVGSLAAWDAWADADADHNVDVVANGANGANGHSANGNGANGKGETPDGANGDETRANGDTDTSPTTSSTAADFDDADCEYPALTSRHSELVAQFSAALADAHVLAQALLLDSEEDRLTHLTPFFFFSGTALHSLLSGVDPIPATGWRWGAAHRTRYRDTLAAVLADLPPHALAMGRTVVPKSPPTVRRERKKDKKSKKGAAAPVPAAGGSRFELLMSEGL